MKKLGFLSHRIGLIAISTFVLAGIAQQTLAGPDEFEQVVVLDHPRYSLTGKVALDLDFNYLPLDAFYKPVMLDIAVSYQINDWFAIEPIRFGWSLFNYDTGLTKAIEDQPELKAAGRKLRNNQELNKLKFKAGGAGYLNMLYGKSNFFNKTIVYHYWQFGLGMTYYNFDSFTITDTNGPTKKSPSQVSADLILRARFFIDDRWTVTIRGSHSIGFQSGAPGNITQLSVGAGFAF